MMARFVCDEYYPDQWEPPIFESRLDGDSWVDPYLVNLIPVSQLYQCVDFEAGKARDAVQSFYEYSDA